jgi:hypothetical protein
MYNLWKANNATANSEKQISNVEFCLKAIDKFSGSVNADMAADSGRNLLTVLGVSTISAAMAAIRTRCNGTGVPDFSGIMIGDYIDGLNLSGITAPTSGTASAAWNDTNKNNRIVVSGFNTYKGAGSTENTQNHILFTFRHCIALGRMNSTDTNANGFNGSEIKTWLDGAFKTGLESQIGAGYVYPIQKMQSRKSSNSWDTVNCWLPTEVEVFGCQVMGDELTAGRSGTPIQLPIYQRSYEYRIKRWNGNRYYYWLGTPYASNTSDFCGVSTIGSVNGNSASGSYYGVSPAFCVR